MLELRGERVLLRTPSEGEAEALRAIHSTLEVSAWWNLPGERFPFEPDATSLAILAEDEVAGFIQFEEEAHPDYKQASIDVFVDPRRHRAGVGTDALRALIRHLTEERGHHRITIDPATDNQPAIDCYAKVGFQTVGVMKSCWRDLEGCWRDGLLMELVVEAPEAAQS